MQYVDGNALGGTFLELFGVELTTATGVCGSCGKSGEVATLRSPLIQPQPNRRLVRQLLELQRLVSLPHVDAPRQEIRSLLCVPQLVCGA